MRPPIWFGAKRDVTRIAEYMVEKHSWDARAALYDPVLRGEGPLPASDCPDLSHGSRQASCNSDAGIPAPSCCSAPGSTSKPFGVRNSRSKVRRNTLPRNFPAPAPSIRPRRSRSDRGDESGPADLLLHRTAASMEGGQYRGPRRGCHDAEGRESRRSARRVCAGPG